MMFAYLQDELSSDSDADIASELKQDYIDEGDMSVRYLVRVITEHVLKFRALDIHYTHYLSSIALYNALVRCVYYIMSII